MVASFHGHRIDLAGLRQRFTLSLKGATLAYLMQVAGRLHLAPRPLRLELDELPQLKTPCILHWDLNHFVVLKSRQRARGRDPRPGLRREAPADGGSLEALHRHRPRARADRRLPSARRAPPRAPARPDGTGDGPRPLAGAGAAAGARAAGVRRRSRPSTCSGWSTARSSRPTATCSPCWAWASCCSRPSRWRSPRCAPGSCSTSGPRSTCSGSRTSSRTCCACRWRGSRSATWATWCRASAR